MRRHVVRPHALGARGEPARARPRHAAIGGCPGPRPDRQQSDPGGTPRARGRDGPARRRRRPRLLAGAARPAGRARGRGGGVRAARRDRRARPRVPVGVDERGLRVALQRSCCATQGRVLVPRPKLPLFRKYLARLEVGQGSRPHPRSRSTARWHPQESPAVEAALTHAGRGDPSIPTTRRALPQSATGGGAARSCAPRAASRSCETGGVRGLRLASPDPRRWGASPPTGRPRVSDGRAVSTCALRSSRRGGPRCRDRGRCARRRWRGSR